MKKIKNKTYNNFIYIMKQIQKKGYTAAEAEKLTHGIFDAYTANPNGISIETRLNRIISKDEYNRLYA